MSDGARSDGIRYYHGISRVYCSTCIVKGLYFVLNDAYIMGKNIVWKIRVRKTSTL